MTTRSLCLQSVAQLGRVMPTDQEIAYHLLIDLIPGIMGGDTGMQATVDSRLGRLELTVRARCASGVEAHLLFEAVGADPVETLIDLDGCNECVAVRSHAWKDAWPPLATVLMEMCAADCSVSFSELGFDPFDESGRSN